MIALVASTVMAAEEPGPVTCGPSADREMSMQALPLGEEASGGRLASIAMVDINGDGAAELVGAVVPQYGQSSPMGLWSTALRGDSARLRSLGGLSFSGLYILPGDVDGNGNVDVVLADPGNDELIHILWLPDGVAVSPSYTADIGPEPILADLGPDGSDELLSVSPIGVAAAWAFTGGPPAVLVQGTVADGVAQAVGDLDGDGAPEWILAQGARSQLTVAWGGDLLTQQRFSAGVQDPRGLVARDLNFDGTAELLVLDRKRAAVRLLRGEKLRPGPWIVRLKVPGARKKPQSLHVADVDDDGCLDVLLHSFATKELAIAWGGNRDRYYVQRLRTGPGPVALGAMDATPGADIAVVDDDRVLVFSMVKNAAGKAR